APAVVLTAQQTRAPQRTIAHDVSSDEQRVTPDTSEVERHDGGGADGSEGAVSAPLKEPAQQETGDSREEAGVTVQAELDPTTTTTDRSDGGGDGIEGFGGGDWRDFVRVLKYRFGWVAPIRRLTHDLVPGVLRRSRRNL